MEDKNKVTIGIETRGFDEAAEDIELMADAMNEFPATVNIKAKDCRIHVHTRNIIEMAEPEPAWAKGEVKLEADLDLECTPGEDEVVLPKGTVKEMCMVDFLKEAKKMCGQRISCSGCFLEDGSGNCIVCGLPDHWRI